MNSKVCRLGVFAKYWEPGKVKTRLAASIGATAAASLYREFVATIVRRFEFVPNRELVYTPRVNCGDFQELLSTEKQNWQLRPQEDGNLGNRMKSFFLAPPDSGVEKTVLIGSDSPTLPDDHVRDAFNALSTHDVVLGPTEDGGYYLIGCRGKPPAIFEGIPWSTNQVWPETVRQLQKASIRFKELPIWYDVDEITDLRRLQSELTASPLLTDPCQRLRTQISKVLNRVE